MFRILIKELKIDVVLFFFLSFERRGTQWIWATISFCDDTHDEPKYYLQKTLSPLGLLALAVSGLGVVLLWAEYQDNLEPGRKRIHVKQFFKSPKNKTFHYNFILQSSEKNQYQEQWSWSKKVWWLFMD